MSLVSGCLLIGQTEVEHVAGRPPNLPIHRPCGIHGPGNPEQLGAAAPASTAYGEGDEGRSGFAGVLAMNDQRLDAGPGRASQLSRVGNVNESDDAGVCHRDVRIGSLIRDQAPESTQRCPVRNGRRRAGVREHLRDGNEIGAPGTAQLDWSPAHRFSVAQLPDVETTDHADPPGALGLGRAPRRVRGPRRRYDVGP